MGRLWTAGAELQTATAGIEFTSIFTTAPVVDTSVKRSGNASWKIHNSGAAEGLRQLHTSAQGSFFFRSYFRFAALPTGAAVVIGGARTTGAAKLSWRLTSGGLLQLWNTEDNTQIGTDSSEISLDTWYRLEMNYDTTTLNATTCEAKAFTDTPGNDTPFWNPSGSADMSVNITTFWIGITAADTTLDYYVDDLAINDTSDPGNGQEMSWCGEGEVIVLRPNGNGDASDWGGSDGNSTDNYLLIDEVPPDSADYVEDNTLDQIDEWEMEATPAALESSDTINVVHVGVYAAVSDAASADPDIVLRIKAAASGTVEESAALDVNSVTYQGPAPLPANSNYQLTLYDLPGASTTAWTKTELDTMQIGVRVSTGDTHFARIAAAWVMIDHKPGEGDSTAVKDIIGSGIIPFAR